MLCSMWCRLCSKSFSSEAELLRHRTTWDHRMMQNARDAGSSHGNREHTVSYPPPLVPAGQSTHGPSSHLIRPGLTRHGERDFTPARNKPPHSFHQMSHSKAGIAASATKHSGSGSGVEISQKYSVKKKANHPPPHHRRPSKDILVGSTPTLIPPDKRSLSQQPDKRESSTSFSERRDPIAGSVKSAGQIHQSQHDASKEQRARGPPISATITPSPRTQNRATSDVHVHAHATASFDSSAAFANPLVTLSALIQRPDQPQPNRLNTSVIRSGESVPKSKDLDVNATNSASKAAISTKNSLQRATVAGTESSTFTCSTPATSSDRVSSGSITTTDALSRVVKELKQPSTASHDDPEAPATKKQKVCASETYKDGFLVPNPPLTTTSSHSGKSGSKLAHAGREELLSTRSLSLSPVSLSPTPPTRTRTSAPLSSSLQPIDLSVVKLESTRFEDGVAMTSPDPETPSAASKPVATAATAATNGSGSGSTTGSVHVHVAAGERDGRDGSSKTAAKKKNSNSNSGGSGNKNPASWKKRGSGPPAAAAVAKKVKQTSRRRAKSSKALDGGGMRPGSSLQLHGISSSLLSPVNVFASEMNSLNTKEQQLQEDLFVSGQEVSRLNSLIADMEQEISDMKNKKDQLVISCEKLTTEYKEVLGQKQELLSSHTKIPEDLSFSSPLLHPASPLSSPVTARPPSSVRSPPPVRSPAPSVEPIKSPSSKLSRSRKKSSTSSSREEDTIAPTCPHTYTHTAAADNNRESSTPSSNREHRMSSVFDFSQPSAVPEASTCMSTETSGVTKAQVHVEEREQKQHGQQEEGSLLFLPEPNHAAASAGDSSAGAGTGSPGDVALVRKADLETKGAVAGPAASVSVGVSASVVAVGALMCGGTERDKEESESVCLPQNNSTVSMMCIDETATSQGQLEGPTEPESGSVSSVSIEKQRECSTSVEHPLLEEFSKKTAEEPSVDRGVLSQRDDGKCMVKTEANGQSNSNKSSVSDKDLSGVDVPTGSGDGGASTSEECRAVAIASATSTAASPASVAVSGESVQEPSPEQEVPGCRVMQFKSHSSSVLTMKLNGNRLYTSSSDKSTRVYDKNTGEVIGQYDGHEKVVTCIAFYECENATFLLSGSADRMVHLYNIKNRKMVARFKCGTQVMYMCVNGSLLFVGLNIGVVIIMDLKNKLCVGKTTCHKKKAISCMCVDGNQRLYTAAFDHRVTCWNIQETSSEKYKITLHPFHQLTDFNGVVLCMKAHQNHLFIGNGDKSLKVFDSNSWEVLHEITCHKGAVSSLDIMGKILITGSFDKLIRCFDLERLELLQVYGGNSDMVFSLCASDGIIYSGLKNGVVQAIPLDLTVYYQCHWQGCDLKRFGLADHLKQHILEHVKHITEEAKGTCKWDGCTTELRADNKFYHMVVHLSVEELRMKKEKESSN